MCAIYGTISFNLPYVLLCRDILMTKFAYVQFTMWQKLIINALREIISYYFKTKHNKTYQHHKSAYEKFENKFS